MTESGQMKNKKLEKLEKKLQKLKETNRSLWNTYGSELCTGEMIAEEKALEKKIKELNFEDDLGEMIHVWIEHHGSLDLSIPEKKIKEFYKKTINNGMENKD